jgi:hypothetical protein
VRRWQTCQRLTQADPITASSFQPNEGTPPISWGFAIDGVTAVSFMADGQEVTVPVNNQCVGLLGRKPAPDGFLHRPFQRRTHGNPTGCIALRNDPLAAKKLSRNVCLAHDINRVR